MGPIQEPLQHLAADWTGHLLSELQSAGVKLDNIETVFLLVYIQTTSDGF